MPIIDLAYALSGESKDPFYIPPRETEIGSFIAASICFALLVAVVILVPLDRSDIPIVCGMAIVALFFLVRGVRARRYRKRRVREVNDLHEKLARNGTGA